MAEVRIVSYLPDSSVWKAPLPRLGGVELKLRGAVGGELV